ncbi:phosphoethanolamine transferase EptA [Lysobacter helvus]|uniref:Phosphoethanolamine transferase EptA n=2 Tax=Lysobacteraceae TaxID=32033 RepID=A0ABM7Q9M1_9GAMM|nr:MULTISPECIES: phosphoethanolamine--lipid A transferase EptA [Lysobacter]BCT94062.1 phosphoethanolamine transferase EptA [Lysobacter caseinilyticus]BCT97218.1 phosphoethanolamine transferase EptA [Lysobacter helvus]
MTPRNFSFHCSHPTFVAAFTAANLVLFGWPLYTFALSTLDPRSASGLACLLVLTVVQAVLMVMTLAAVSLLSLRTMKALCIVLLVGNSLALYFIDTYHVLLDKSMMGNVFATDRAQTFELFHPKLLVYVLLLGVLPAWIVAKTVILDARRRARLRVLVIAGVLGCVVVYAGSSTWLWFDKHARSLGGLMLPWSYLANTVRLFDDRAASQRAQAPLPALHFLADAHPDRKTIVVLVIGESARASNFSLYGYKRNTNPELAKAGVIALPDAHACATYTTAAIRCMLSSIGSDAPARVSQETLPNYLQRHGVQVIWRTNNWGEPPLHVQLFQRADDIRKTCTGIGCDALGHDDVLLYQLRDMLARSASRRILVVLHLAGSHGPTYTKRVPPAFARFQPACESVDLGACSQAALVNAYDNTILYTDHVLAETIHVLQAVPQSDSTMLYLSDHGESLGEHGFYLHGAPNAIAPDVQRVVPFLVWMSPGFSASRHVSAGDLRAKPPFGDDNVFHSVVGAFGGRSAVYKPERDVFNRAN